MATEAPTAPSTPSPPPPRKRRRRRRWLLILLSLSIAGVADACIPRRADLRRFDPNELAALETGMWRDYYEYRRLALARKLYSVWRGQYGFSPWDSARLAWRAAKAAMVFKVSTNDAEADKALPILRTHFEIIASRIDPSFDIDQATQAELLWWKIRRHDVGPVEYGHAVARATAILYHIDPNSIEPHAQQRAAAMDYRDQRHLKMTDEDWEKVRVMLLDSFTQLKQVVGPAK